MAKVNYDAFDRFDINECCDYFEVEDQRQWKKINKFIVADEQEYVATLVNEFKFEDTADDEYEAFMSGVKYALTKMNIAFKAAGVDLKIQEVDLVEGMGHVLTRTKDTPESFVKRVLEKPAPQSKSWL
jgi:hypothetical protein